jgi:transposase
MNKHFQVPLNLPDIQILQVGQTDSGAWLIQVESTLQETQCRKCGKTITEFHGFDDPIRLRHLPVFEVPIKCQPLSEKTTTNLASDSKEIEIYREEK